MNLKSLPLSSNIYRRKSCRLCQGSRLELVFSLAPTPPANAFIKKSELNHSQERYPLDVFFCQECFHVQLLDVVDPALLFRDYVYVSGTSPVFVEHFKNYSEYLLKRFPPSLDSFVFEIGSNDGTLLRFFKEKGFSVLGVDPAQAIAYHATQQGVETWPEFFDSVLADRVLNQRGKADIIIANNVFAHIDDLVGVTQGIKKLLSARGVFAFEVSYLGDVYQKTLFDTIYHEHLCYHSVQPLESFFRQNGLELIEAHSVDSHGGSLRGIVQLANGHYPKGKSVEELLQREKNLGLDKAETFKNYAQKIETLKTNLKDLLVGLKSQGKKIAGFGAPAKATTLMHHFGIGGELVDFIVDDSPLKQGLFSPGLHIPVLPSSEIQNQKPDYLLILAWNFAESIISKNKRFLEEGGHFIIPVPQVEVI